MNNKNCNMIISNLILSKKEPFTYNEILEEIKKEIGEDWEITSALNQCLYRMQNDGFLKYFDSTYTVTVYDVLSENKNVKKDEEYESMEDLIKEMEEIENKKKELEKKIKDKANEMITNILKRINKDIKLMQDIGYYIDYENEYVLDSFSDTYDDESKRIYAKLRYKPRHDLAKNK